MRSGRRDRAAGGRAVLTMVGLPALLAGVVLIGVGLAGQVPDPPRAGASLVQEHGAHTAASEEAVPSNASPTSGTPTTLDLPAQLPAAEDEASTALPSAEEPPPTFAALPASEPVAVRIPTLDVLSPLHALGLAADGTLEVPSGARVDQAAWYSGSPTPGETGPSVIEGHVTGPGGRPSVFFELAALSRGDRVEVDRADGSTAVFEVYRVESHPKDRFPTVAVYGPTGGPELRLITCGGEFDDATGHHVDNTVVFARAVAAKQA